MKDNTIIESPVRKERCPSKHNRAYKTTFGKMYCPDCNHDIEVTANFVKPARLPKGAYAKDLKEVTGGYKRKI